jgi:hypothetical protein
MKDKNSLKRIKLKAYVMHLFFFLSSFSYPTICLFQNDHIHILALLHESGKSNTESSGFSNL